MLENLLNRAIFKHGGPAGQELRLTARYYSIATLPVVMIATIHSIQYHDESNYRDGRNYCYESNYSICNVMSCCFIVEFSCM